MRLWHGITHSFFTIFCLHVYFRQTVFIISISFILFVSFDVHTSHTFPYLLYSRITGVYRRSAHVKLLLPSDYIDMDTSNNVKDKEMKEYRNFIENKHVNRTLEKQRCAIPC